ncbi:MAG: hypothetical protein WC628_06165 [Candidatus Omnitrophota bacterium]
MLKRFIGFGFGLLFFIIGSSSIVSGSISIGRPTYTYTGTDAFIIGVIYIVSGVALCIVSIENKK